MRISIIVPMYYGQKYVKQMINQVEQCAKEADGIDVELILYNDCPEEEIKVMLCEHIQNIKCINADQNLGIQGARVQGLKYATGEYVLFLDQDDIIKPQYIKSQMNMIGNADAVVCRVIHNKRLHYTDSFRFEEVVTKEFMLHKWNSIVSPGQVIIKKSAIPEAWKTKILKTNGADDYMLWLLMMLEGKAFSLNDDILFEHIVSGDNFSENTNKMMDSEDEMISILKSCTLCEEAIWDSLKDSLRRIHVKDLDTGKYSFNVLKKIVCKRDRWLPVEVKNVAIYGAGELGISLSAICKRNGIAVRCLIDRNAEFILSDIPVYKLEDIPNDVDTIIVSLKDRRIKEEIEKQNHGIKVYMIEDLIKK